MSAWVTTAMAGEKSAARHSTAKHRHSTVRQSRLLLVLPNAVQRKELEAQLKTLANDKSTAIQRKNLLDQQIANTTSQIANVEQQIAQYDQLITQKEEELAQSEREQQEQYELFCQRVRLMEEQGEGA